jgi:hypothetical protein
MSSVGMKLGVSCYWRNVYRRAEQGTAVPLPVAMLFIVCMRARHSLQSSLLTYFICSQDSSVSIVTKFRAGRRGFNSWQEQRYFSSPSLPDRLWSLPGNEGSFPGVKQPGREADHSPSSSSEVKNVGAISPIALCLNSGVHN